MDEAILWITLKVRLEGLLCLFRVLVFFESILSDSEFVNKLSSSLDGVSIDLKTILQDSLNLLKVSFPSDYKRISDLSFMVFFRLHIHLKNWCWTLRRLEHFLPSLCHKNA